MMLSTAPTLQHQSAKGWSRKANHERAAGAKPHGQADAAYYVKAQCGKNDANDAAAICEAVTRPSMRFIPIATAVRLDTAPEVMSEQCPLYSQKRTFPDRLAPIG